jgi:hypothetical protein
MPRTAAVALLVAAAACVPDQGPSMRPFEDCLGCHDGGEARAWTVAGTWARGAEIAVVDAGGKSVTMRGNDVGNFYTRESLTFPLAVWVDGTRMAANGGAGAPIALQYGGCNVCHHAQTVTVGPLMAPGSDCLSCHGPGGMATVKFSAAGTVTVGGKFPAGSTVVVGGRSTVANAVGNFYFDAITQPITFPAAASVHGTLMEGGAPRGGCNGCHLGGIGSGQGIVGGD